MGCNLAFGIDLEPLRHELAGSISDFLNPCYTFYDNWDPGIPRSLIYVCPIITTPPALYAAFVAKRFFLMPNVPAPYSYIVIAGAVVILVLISYWRSSGVYSDNLVSPVPKLIQ